MYKEPPYQEEGNTQEKVVMMTMLIEGHIEIKDSLREGNIQIKVEGHLIGKDTLIGDLLEEDIPIEMKTPLEEEDTPEEDPLMEEEDTQEEDPDGNGRPPMEEDPLDLLVDKDHQVLKDPLDQ